MIPGPPLPTERGPISGALLHWWIDGTAPKPLQLAAVDPLTDDDLHLALWCCYHLHFGGFAGLPDDLEWDPITLGIRRQLERAFESALVDEHNPAGLPADPVTALRVIAEWSGPPLSKHIASSQDRTKLTEFAIHRSAYQLKEADAHTFAIPRLRGPGRSAMIAIQADEYGEGVAGRAHSELFAAAMAELGLDASFGAYIDQLPGATLATDNLVSMFGLHRRLRGAAVGHLALFEMTSVGPMANYLVAARAAGADALARFYEVHVDIDAHHATLATERMVAPMAAASPELAPAMIFGAAALSRVEARFARRVLRSWNSGTSSLLPRPPVHAIDLTVPARPRELTAVAGPTAA